MAIEITQTRKDEILHSFIENADFYKTTELKEVRKIIVDIYYNDYELFDKISKSIKTRNLLSSVSLLKKIKSEVANGSYEFINDETYLDILFLIKCFNKYQDTFFTQELLIVSLDFIEYVIKLVDADIVKKNIADEFKDEINDFFIYFKRIIEKIEIKEAKEENKFQSVYASQVKAFFQHNNHQYASIWFRFYFLYYSNSKDKSARKTDVINTIATPFIRSSNKPEELRRTISDCIDLKEFMALETNFFTEIFNLCKTKPLFGIEFYNEFDVDKKQELIEFYVPINRNKTIPNLKQLLEGIDYDIPKKIEFSNKILKEAKTNTVHTEIKELYDIFFSSNLDEKIINSSDYSNQIISLICNSNAQLHKLGVEQFIKNSDYIDYKELKEKVIPFLLTIITDLVTYSHFFINILNLKIGINKRFFDKELNKNTSYLAHINNYIVSSGNINFYNTIISKVKDETIININDHFIRSISYDVKFNSILNIIYGNKNLLSDDLHNKLSQLISNIE